MSARILGLTAVALGLAGLVETAMMLQPIVILPTLALAVIAAGLAGFVRK